MHMVESLETRRHLRGGSPSRRMTPRVAIWDGPDMYLKAVKRLGLYVCTMYKNGSNVRMCLDEEELILLEEHVLLKKPTPHQKKMWDLRATATMKSEELLKQNIRSHYIFVMSLCDPIMVDKVSCHESFATIKRSR